MHMCLGPTLEYIPADSYVFTLSSGLQLLPIKSYDCCSMEGFGGTLRQKILHKA